jgi:hypothetical protein
MEFQTKGKTSGTKNVLLNNSLPEDFRKKEVSVVLSFD